jgi:hypothetical protein
VRHPLLIGHHVLSILFFPYATLRHRSLLVVLFFVFTEVGLAGRLTAASCRAEQRAACCGPYV